jgi:predicted CoA-binding protein
MKDGIPSQSAIMSDDIREILTTSKTVAVVGLSEDPARPSHYVAAYLQKHGYRIIPVNPLIKEVLGEKSYASLREIPIPIDMVDVFRRSDAMPAIVEDAIAVRAKSVWMQEGVIHEEAAARARAAGLKVVMDRCTLKEHSRLAAEKR